MKFPGVRDYPEYVVIRGNPWDIHFCRKIPDTDKDTLGLCDPGEKVLYIKLGQSRKDIFKTLIHEMLHAMEDEYCYAIPHNIIHKMEDSVSDVLLENIDLIGNFIFLMLGSKR